MWDLNNMLAMGRFDFWLLDSSMNLLMCESYQVTFYAIENSPNRLNKFRCELA